MNRIFKLLTVGTLLIVVALVLGGTLAATSSPATMVTPTPAPVGQEATPAQAPSQPAAPQPETPDESPYSRGFIPPQIERPHLNGQRMSPSGTSVQTLPSSFDWRNKDGSNYVTSMKNQGACGSCYTFASLGNVESKMLIDGAGTYNFSENNAKECNWRELNDFQSPLGTYWGSCDGGNYYMMANLFSKEGTVLEADDSYVASDVSCTTPVSYSKTLLDWRVVSDNAVPSTSVLKQYIYDNGPVYTSLYSSFPGFDTYDGSYTLYYAGSESTDHAVLIVGWDDSLSHSGPGSGGWVVKNSWGTDWGGTCGYGTERGYFTIAYGSASIGEYSSYMHAWQDYDTYGDVWYFDDDGLTADWGCGTTSWGLARFTADSDTYVTRVEFWTTDQTTDVDVYLYDSFDGSNLGTLLAQKLNNTFNEAGYHSVALDSPVAVSNGSDVVAVVRVTNNSYTHPITLDSNGTSETGRTYVSCDGSSWTDAGSTWSCDVGVRVRTSSAPTPNVGINKQVIGSNFDPGDPITFTLTINNSGSEVASNVVVTDSIPSEVMTLTVASTLDITATGTISYVWEVEPLAIGESGVITIYGQIDPNLDDGSSFENEATISDPEDKTSGNNTNSSGTIVVGARMVYLPVVLNNHREGPDPGFWQGYYPEFYVTTDRVYVDDFAIYINVAACGLYNYKITHGTPEPISDWQFSFTGSFYASGTFDSKTSASGSLGLNSYYISGCGNVSLPGAQSWSATWQDSSQPSFILELADPVAIDGVPGFNAVLVER